MQTNQKPVWVTRQSPASMEASEVEFGSVCTMKEIFGMDTQHPSVSVTQRKCYLLAAAATVASKLYTEALSGTVLDEWTPRVHMVK